MVASDTDSYLVKQFASYQLKASIHSLVRSLMNNINSYTTIAPIQNEMQNAMDEVMRTTNLSTVIFFKKKYISYF